MTLLTKTVALVKAARSDRLPVATGGIGNLAGALGETRNVNEQLNAYGVVGWLFAVIERIATAVSASEWQLYRKVRVSGGKVKREEVFDHPMLDLWRSPSPFSTQDDFLESTQQHLDLVGEGWWVVVRGEDGVGAPTELQLVRPDRMRPLKHPTQFISGYEYRVASFREVLGVDDVIFLRRPSPLDPYRGMGPVQSLMFDLGAEKMAAQWSQNFFRNSAQPAGIIQMDHEMSDAEFGRFVSRWREMHQGVSNAHRVGILEKATWVPAQFTMRDMQFKDLRTLNRDLITGTFGVPNAMLGVSEQVNRANAEAAEVMFGRWVIRPRLSRIKGQLNQRLIPMFGETDLEFDFIDPTPDDRAANLMEARDGYLNGFITLNEARYLIDLPGVDDGDDFFEQPAPFTLAMDRAQRPGATEKAPEWSDWIRGTLEDGVAQQKDAIATAERTMQKAWRKRLREERDGVIEHLQDAPETRAKAASFAGLVTKLELSDLDSYDWNWYAKYGDDLVDELARVVELAIVQAFPEMENQAKRLAMEYAEQRGGELLRLDGDVNIVRLTRERVGKLVAANIEAGEGIGTLARNLRNDFAFSPSRASGIARTETATAQGQGAYSAAMAQGLDEKSWLTQGDQLVEDDCKKNAAAGWIKISQPFPSGLDSIPQHPNCRCSTIYRATPISDVTIETDSVNGHRSIADQVGAWGESR